MNAIKPWRLSTKIDPRDCRLKVGKEMFTLFGPQLVRDLQQRGFDVFLDLKFHDIPNTTARGSRRSGRPGVWMVNVHSVCGARMMAAARDALAPFGKDAPLLIAVTVLTSMETSDLHDLGVTLSPAEHAERLARLTQQCGLDGVVCSAQEAVRFKQVFGAAFKLVTPGIRPAGSEAGDPATHYDARTGIIRRRRLYGDWPPGYAIGRSGANAEGY
ncbi:Orotidine 5'-phosphate decarboxylase [Salmonella enterica subsp. enterica]|uniref:Orotidine 5'-phosphate decarboxylase n=1 Tax=Salmonella enterica I TaxID=59201 RepID=A0A447N9P7_SALET|nr:Orotidine 5'-phosphate decarboxylase [Salmonella enterica subsp. enterica]